MEAMVFTTLIFLGIQRSLNRSLSRRGVFSFSDSVRVFGDDLIVPTDHVLSVIRTLEHFGASVGADKSFWTGRFRESCGKEYFNGADVSIVRCRQALPTTPTDVTEVISLVALRNQLYLSGYWKTCQWLDEQIRGLLKYFPDVEPTSSVLGRVTSLGYQAERMHPSLHTPLVKGYVVKAKAPRNPLEDYGALLKCFHLFGNNEIVRSETPTSSRPESMPNVNGMAAFGGLTPIRSVNEDHLERSGRPKHVDIKLGWRSPF
jgi:hypothetical protein